MFKNTVIFLILLILSIYMSFGNAYGSEIGGIIYEFLIFGLLLCIAIIHIWKVCVAIINTWRGDLSMYERITSTVMMPLFLIVIFFTVIFPTFAILVLGEFHLNFYLGIFTLNFLGMFVLIPATIISIPAFIFLRKRNYLFWWDCMIPLYGINLLFLLEFFAEAFNTPHPHYNADSFFGAIIFIAAFSIVLNYIRVLAIRFEAVKKFTPMQISKASIVMMLLFTFLMFFVRSY